MAKDKRYLTVKNLIDGNYIEKFSDIFDVIPKSVLYLHLGINNKRFNALLKNVEQFLLKDIFRIADYFEVEKEKMVSLMMKEYQSKKRKGKK